MLQRKPKMKIEFKPRQAGSDTLDLYIYDDIESGGYDWWTGEDIESETSQEFFRETLAEHPNVSEIHLYVNSLGGSVYEAMGIRAQLIRHPATVIAHVDGWAASAASLILTGCDEIIMNSAAMQMVHNMWTIAIGNSTELRQIADQMDKMMEGNRRAYLDKAGDKLTEEHLIELMENETWLTADECVQLGLADTIAKLKPDARAKALRQQMAPMRQSMLSVVAIASDPGPIESQPELKPDDDIPPDVVETEPAEPANDDKKAAGNSGFSDFMAAIVRAAEGRIQ